MSDLEKQFEQELLDISERRKGNAAIMLFVSCKWSVPRVVWM